MTKFNTTSKLLFFPQLIYVSHVPKNKIYTIDSMIIMLFNIPIFFQYESNHKVLGIN